MYHYDSLPYESNTFPETHPRSLAMLATLLRVPAADPDACRVLEMGCAAGGNLIPMAWQLPGSDFVGIDLEPRQVREGQALIGELGLRNITLAQGDIAQLGGDLGQFDYIIAHGVFSWVPDEVREAMLALYRRLLKPHGIGYISYNTRPGWHVRGMLREMLLYHTQGIEDPREGLEAAAAFMAMYAQTLQRQSGPLAQHMLLELASLRDAHPSYLYHEYLERHNRPLLFSEFDAMAQRHGLRYLCEAKLQRMFPSQLGAQAEAFLEGLEDSRRHEQYLDFFDNRTFRQSLLVQGEVEPDYDIDLDRLEGLACAADLAPPPEADRRRRAADAFTTADGRSITVEDPLARAMLHLMHARYPSAAGLAELRDQAAWLIGETPAAAAQASNWQAELFTLYANGLVQLVPVPLDLDSRGGGRPRLHALARVWVAHGARNLPTAWHRPLNTDAFSLRLLAGLDGGRDRGALIELLLADMQACRLPLPDGDLAPQDVRRVVAANVDRLLELFRRSGLFEPAGEPSVEG